MEDAVGHAVEEAGVFVADKEEETERDAAVDDDSVDDELI